jgi:L-fuculose-phosphate aldolase
MDVKGWVANHDGNISARIDSHKLLITPTARSKADLTETDLVEVGYDGKKISGSGNPFSELALHLKVYEIRSEIGAVVHAHPTSSMAVGCSNQEMLTWAVPEAVVSLGPGIPLVGLDVPWSKDLEAEFEALIPHYDAVMIAGNGVFAWGKNLEQAFLRLELVEHLATINLKSQGLGGPQLLKPEKVAELMARREKAGLMLPKDPSRPAWFPA